MHRLVAVHRPKCVGPQLADSREIVYCIRVNFPYHKEVLLVDKLPVHGRRGLRFGVGGLGLPFFNGNAVSGLFLLNP